MKKKHSGEPACCTENIPAGETTGISNTESYGSPSGHSCGSPTADSYSVSHTESGDFQDDEFPEGIIAIAKDDLTESEGLRVVRYTPTT